MRKIFEFFRVKENRETISWAGGGLVAAGGLVFSALNYFSPQAAKTVTPADQSVVVSQATPCDNPADLVIYKDGFVFVDSDKRQLETAEIATLNSCQKWIARNEIFARHGRPFSNPVLDRHFRAQAWYKIKVPFDKPSDLELQNADAIRAFEKQ